MNQLPHDWRALLKQAREGDREAEEKLYGLIGQFLGGTARRLLASPRSRGKNSLETVMLINDAYMELMADYPIEDQRHLKRFAVRVMRHRIIDYVNRSNRKGRDKKRQNSERIESKIAGVPAVDPLELEEVRKRVGSDNDRRTQVLDLYFYGRFKVTEIADLLQVGEATVKRDLAFIRACLMEYFETSEKT